MRRFHVAVAVAALATVLGTGYAAAHPGPVDARGGHYCRPAGGGAADCLSVGVEPGRYHCEQDPCLTTLQSRAEDWCAFGVPYPTASDLTGLFPEQPFIPPIRVDRLGGSGHVLVMERDLEPLVDPPGDCLDSDRALELHLPSDAVAAHLSADGGPPPHGAADPVSGAPIAASSLGFERLSEPAGLGGTWMVVVAALAAATGAARRRRRPRHHWEA